MVKGILVKSYKVTMFIDETATVKTVEVSTKAEARTLVEASRLCGWICVVCHNDELIIF